MRIVRYVFLIILFAQTSILQAQWIQTQGPSGGSITGLVSTGSTVFATVNPGGVYRSTNNGISWNPTNTGLSNTSVWTLVVTGTNIFVGTEGGGIFLSTDSGSTWSPANGGLSNKNVKAIALSGANIFAGTDSGVYLSTNGGTLWNAVNAGLTNTNVWALAAHGTDLFAGTMGGVFRSTNNGISWTAANNGLPADFFRGVFVVSGTNLFAGKLGNGVFISTNDGSSWNRVNTGLANTDIFSLFCQGSNIYAGSGNGVYHSANNGASWNKLGSGLPTNDNVVSLTSIGNVLFAGTEHLGIYKLDTVNTGIAQSQSPLRFSLGQNYPNPFNPSTTFIYRLSAAGNVTLKVFDVLGREVATLVNEFKHAGSYTVQWNASTMPSGVYFCRLSAGSLTETKKLILLK